MYLFAAFLQHRSTLQLGCVSPSTSCYNPGTLVSSLDSRSTNSKCVSDGADSTGGMFVVLLVRWGSEGGGIQLHIDSWLRIAMPVVRCYSEGGRGVFPVGFRHFRNGPSTVTCSVRVLTGRGLDYPTCSRFPGSTSLRHTFLIYTWPFELWMGRLEWNMFSLFLFSRQFYCIIDLVINIGISIKYLFKWTVCKLWLGCRHTNTVSLILTMN